MTRHVARRIHPAPLERGPSRDPPRDRGDETDPLVAHSRATWSTGDFQRIAVGFAGEASEFVRRLALESGTCVLDVSCRTGNLSIPAAHAGAVVTGLDIAPALLDTARRRAADAGLTIQFDEGHPEALPYADASFDLAISMFGIMFTARPEPAARELTRVVRPGGRIVLADWIPAGFIGRMFQAHTSRAPLPAGMPNPLLWGDPDVVRERFGDRVRELTFTPRTLTFLYPLSPAGVVELFRSCYGPTIRAFEALDADSRAAFALELTRLWTGRNRASGGMTRVEADYLEVSARVV
jgi:SAM-dependent methyltransferase